MEGERDDGGLELEFWGVHQAKEEWKEGWRRGKRGMSGQVFNLGNRPSQQQRLGSDPPTGLDNKDCFRTISQITK